MTSGVRIPTMLVIDGVQPATAESTLPVWMKPRSVPDHLVIAHLDPADLGLLVNLHALPVRSAGIGPGDCVVPRDRSGRMEKGTVNRGLVATAAQVHFRNLLLNELRVHHLAVDTERLVDLGSPALGSQRGRGMCQREMAAACVKEVEVQFAREALEQFNAGLVKPRSLVGQVIGSHNGGIAAGTPSADVALLQHGDVMDSMVPGQVIGGSKPMSTSPDNDGVIPVGQLRGAAEHPALGVLGAQAKLQQSVGHGRWEAPSGGKS